MFYFSSALQPFEKIIYTAKHNNRSCLTHVKSLRKSSQYTKKPQVIDILGWQTKEEIEKWEIFF